MFGRHHDVDKRAHETVMMKLHAPPTPSTNASRIRQSITMKTSYRLALFTISVISSFSVLLLGPAVVGLSAVGIVAVLCAASSQNLAEESLVSPTRDFQISAL